MTDRRASSREHEPLRLHLRPAAVTALFATAVATIVAANIFVAAHRVIGWAVATVVVAALVAPIVAALDRFMPRALALALTFLVIAVVAAGVVYAAFDGVKREVKDLVETAPAAAERIEARDDPVGRAARDIDLVQLTTQLVDGLDARVNTGTEALVSAAGTAPTYFVTMILTIFVVSFGPRMLANGFAQIPDLKRRARLRRITMQALTRAQLYVLATLAQAVAIGLATYALATWLGVPAPAVFALVAAFAAMLPYVGVVVGCIPTVLLGFAASPWWKVAIAFAIVVALQVVEALIVRQRVDPATVHVGPTVPLVVGLVGFAVYGVGGAMYGAAIAVFLLALADAAATASGEDEELPTPVDDWQDDDEAEQDPDAGGDGNDEAGRDARHTVATD